MNTSPVSPANTYKVAINGMNDVVTVEASAFVAVTHGGNPSFQFRNGIEVVAEFPMATVLGIMNVNHVKA